ncbi:MAG: transposase [Candidatus Pacebacteria bacterium]|nr:transposase [Candidatus Paceibacterota bacterium]
MHNAKTISENHFTYLEFPFELRRMIYTTNAIERLNKEVKKVVKNKNVFLTLKVLSP